MSQDSRKLRTRARLLDAAVEAISQTGYKKAAVAGVLEKAGMARATFYAQFADVADCFVAALELLSDRLLREVDEALEGVAPQEAVDAASGALIGFALAERSAAKVFFIESLAGDRRCLEIRDRACDEIAARLADAWASLPAKEPAPVFSAEILMGGMFRMLTTRLRRAESGLDELSGDLRQWVAAYAAPAGGARWKAFLGLGVLPERVVDAPPPEPTQRLPAGRHRLSAAEVARSQRERALGAMAMLSHEKGYAAVTVEDITASAGISRKAFYTHFPDKEAVAVEANEIFWQEAMTTCATAFFAGSSWPERVWEGGRALVEVISAEPERATLGFVQPHAIGAPAVQHTYDRLMTFTLFVEEGYAYRPEAGDLPRTCSEAIGATMFEIAYRELRERRDVERLRELLPRLAYICLAPFTGPEAAIEFVEGKLAGSTADK